MKRPEDRWNTGTQRMEKALKESTMPMVGYEARQILSEEGYTGDAPYQHLIKLQEREKRRHQQHEVLQRLKEKLQDEDPYISTSKTRRGQQVVRLLRQLIDKQQMVAVIDESGRLRAGIGPVG